MLESVVILVDDRKRDLKGAALIAVHLKQRGIVCHLEPLEAFRAVLGAYRPGMIVFNHLTASQLVAWSKRLADMGVLTAVLLNEGIILDAEQMEFLAGRFHKGAHIDYYFCWNEPHQQALLKQGFGSSRIEVIGIPRFDFYFKPWSDVMRNSEPTARLGGRPRILVCTNFPLAKFKELPRDAADKLFAGWAGRIPVFKEYWRSIEANWNARQEFFIYLDSLVAAGKYEVVLRPHPRENPTYYHEWIKKNSDDGRHVRFEPTDDISKLILNCDLEISCETCTTATESWIAGKPTIELVFGHDPLMYREEHALANVICEGPAELVALVDRELKNLSQPEKAEVRKRFLAKWCNSPDGRSSEKVAEKITEALRKKSATDWSKLTLNDYRRALKLHAYKKLGQAYHFDVLMPLKRLFFGKQYAVKHAAYEKSIKPRDVIDARRRLENALSG